MSRFFSDKYKDLESYTPGEQPRDRQLVKLNTNESPFAPPEKAVRRAAEAARSMHLYCDPDASALTCALAEHYGVSPRQILVTNGSDEILHFAFMAYCDEASPAVFPDITYGFYRVFADLERLPRRIVPLKADLSIDVEACKGAGGTLFLANPNANTGIALERKTIEEILRANPDRVVVVDEAYVDFGAESAIELTKRYENLLVTQTFSKAWSMAGARLGVGIGSEALIADLNTVKYSTDPYNVNSMTQAAAMGALEDIEEIRANIRQVVENREWTAAELRKRGFALTDSKANFLFARHGKVPGKALYEGLKEKGILIRHFGAERIREYIRITVGSRDQMERLTEGIDEVLREAADDRADETGGTE